MKTLYLAVLAVFFGCFLFSSSAYALMIEETIINDTFTINKSIGGNFSNLCGQGSTVELADYLNYDSLNYSLTAYSSAYSFLNINTWLKIFPQSSPQKYALEAVGINAETAYSICPGTAQDYAYYVADNDWYADSITGVNMPSLASKIYLGGVLTRYPGYIDLYNVAYFTSTTMPFFDSFYSGDETTIIIQMVTGCSGGFNCVWASSSNTPIKVVYTVTDWINADTSGTDTSITYFDFESGHASSGYFNEADFAYDAVGNILTPYVPVSFYDSVTSNENDMSDILCSVNGGYSTSPRTSINIPFGTYDIFCFNLTGNHNGYNFYGAIKVINNTNVRGGVNPEFDFYSGFYSSVFNAFTSPSYSPSTPVDNVNLTITWSTTTPITTNLRFRTVLGSEYGAYSTFYGDNETYNNVHSVEIDSSYLEAGTYQLELFGFDNDSSEYTSENYIFTVDSTSEYGSERFDSGIHIIVKESGSDLPLRSTVCLQGEATEFEKLCVPTVRDTNTSYLYGYIEVASFFFFDSGLYNISISSEGHQTINTTVSITYEPYIYTATLGFYETCTVLGYYTSASSCASNLPDIFSLFNLTVTSWYCEYDADECFVYNTDGSCREYGMWAGYGCLDGYHPTGIPVNDTVPIGSGNNETTSVVDTTSSVFSDLFGFNIEGSLAMISIIITIIATIAVTATTKSGLIGAITFIAMIVFFSMVGWFPLVFTIMLALLSSFVAVNWLRKGIAGE